MTYEEIKAYINNKIANGEPLHGYARELAIELALNEKERAN
jgi:hypothetical protein